MNDPDISTLNMCAIKKIINIIDRIAYKQNKYGTEEAINYLVCHRIKNRGKTSDSIKQKNRVDVLIHKMEKYPENKQFKEFVQSHRVWMTTRESWTSEKVQKLIDSKDQFLQLKRLGNSLSDEKIDSICVSNPNLEKISQDFLYLFPKVNVKTPELVD